MQKNFKPKIMQEKKSFARYILDPLNAQKIPKKATFITIYIEASVKTLTRSTVTVFKVMYQIIKTAVVCRYFFSLNGLFDSFK